MGARAKAGAMSACVHGGRYSVGQGKVRLDFSSSVNPLGMPPGALRAIARSAGLASSYPDPDCRELRDALAEYLGISAGQIIAGNGAIEIIHWFARAFAGRRAVIPAPTFCEYQLASDRAGSKVVFVPLQDLQLDADKLVRSSRGASTLYLCNPNNPTGLLATTEVERVLTNTPASTTVLLDECFVELSDGGERNSFVCRLAEFPNLVILRSMTKSFGLAGLRLGYACARPDAIDALKRQSVPWSVNALAQAAGIAAIRERGYLARARDAINRERIYLQRQLSRLPYIPIQSQANFFLVDLGRIDSSSFRDELLEASGILVRDCSSFEGMGRHHVRIAVRPHRENIELVKAMEALKSG